MVVRETGVEGDYYNVSSDLGHSGQLMTLGTPNTYHPCQVNSLQSIILDDLQLHQCYNLTCDRGITVKTIGESKKVTPLPIIVQIR